MWQRFTHAIRPKGNEDHESYANGEEHFGDSDQARPTTPSFSQHPAFHSDDHPPPPSPSKRAKKALMKRLSKAPDAEPLLPSQKFPTSIPKKMKSSLSLKGNDSTPSVRRSNDTARPSQDTFRSLRPLTKRRASLDMLRSLEPASTLPPINTSRPSFDSLRRPTTPGADANFGSTRSILREPNTPGTGQNVRFFSRDAYKVISPNDSLDASHQPALPNFLEDSVKDDASRNIPTDAVRISPTSSKPRPKLSEVFAPASDSRAFGHARQSSDASNLFNLSGTLDLPPFAPGLGFEVNEPLMEPDAVFQQTLAAATDESRGQAPMTSTPFRLEKSSSVQGRENITPTPDLDEAIFYDQEEPLARQDAGLETSISVIQGQTMFYSMDHSHDQAPNRSSGTSSSLISGSSIISTSSDHHTSDPDTSFSSAPPRQSKHRSKMLSETMFHSMLRSRENSKDFQESPVAPSSPPGPLGPTADPFSAHANAYYTPQARVPGTPPKSTHVRGNSREDNIILSLQNQLSIQTELCGQYETDLHARDELVTMMEKKISQSEKDDAKKKAALRVWRKKVTELERAVHYLEDEVESSRHESMERSVMDEASGTALRMLHRQISGLEKEKLDWQRDEGLREEIGILENLVKDKTDEVQRLNEILWKNSESEQRLREGIKQAQDQIEMLGHVSIVVGDGDDTGIHRGLTEKRVSTQNHSHQVAWEAEKMELETRNEGVLVEKARLEEELVAAQSLSENREHEIMSLKAELEAQWQHSEAMTRRLETLENDIAVGDDEKHNLQSSVKELQERLSSMELDWTEAEHHRVQLENDLDDIWNLKEALENEKATSTDTTHAMRSQLDELQQKTQEQEARINTLDHEKEYASSTIHRLEETVRTLTTEASRATEKARHGEQETEQLREKMNTISRDYAHLSEDHERTLAATASQGGEAQMRLQLLLTEKAEVDVEVQTQKDKTAALKEEVERLGKQIQGLHQESADREVKVVQMMKHRDKDREDLQGMNIALDSKQQELELIKRRLGVKGTAGATPAKPVKVLPPRRDSSVFSTPTVPRSRPTSVISDSGRESVASVRDSGHGKTGALLKTSRVSNVSTARSSMGPPPPKMQGAVLPRSKPVLSRSVSNKPSVSSTTPHRRASSTTTLERLKTPVSRPSSGPVSATETGEKENHTAKPKMVATS